MLFKLAWRNIWRNKRRTLITAASILFAVFSASVMSSFQKGAWDHMVNNVVNFYFGYAQVHQNGYWEEQTLDKAFDYKTAQQDIKNKLADVQNVVPRIESFALASYKNKTAGCLVVGTQPELEHELTKLKERISEGTYLTENDQAAIIGEGLAENLKIALNDTIVLISQGYRGVNAAAKYPVKALLDFGSPQLSKQMIYLPIKEAQQFYGAEGLATTLALQFDESKDVEESIQKVKANFHNEEYEVLDYKEMLPELMEARELDTAGARLMMFILYIIITFGIFGTILMMTKERTYEFGVLVSIGMSRWQLALTVWLEIVLLGIVGAIAGIIVSFPVIYYLHTNPIEMTGEMAEVYQKFGVEPILPSVLEYGIFIKQAFVVFLVTTVLAVYPFFKIWNLKPVQAMRA